MEKHLVPKGKASNIMTTTSKKSTKKKSTAGNSRPPTKNNSPAKPSFSFNLAGALKRLIMNTLSFLRNPNTRRALGAFCLVFSILLFIAFVSYFWNGGIDQSQVMNTGIGFLGNGEVYTENWLGRLGTYFSHLLIYQGFGLTAFVLPAYLWLVGWRLLYPQSPIDLKDRFKDGFLTLLIGSTVLAFLTDGLTAQFPFGGAFGSYISLWLYGLLGGIGTSIVLLVATATLIIHLFNIDLADMRARLQAGDSIGSIFRQFFEQKPKSTASKTKTTPNTTERNTNTAPKLGNASELSLDNNPKSSGSSASQSNTQPIAEGEQIILDFDQTLINRSRLAKNMPPPDDILLDIIPPNIDITAPDVAELTIDEDDSNPIHAADYDPTLDLANYQKPPIELLERYGYDLYAEDKIQINREELKRNQDQIIETLRNYNIDIAHIKTQPGPTVTLYEIVPAPGVRISKIRNLEDDIALSLAALGIRIIAPMPGKGTIGIEVPNEKKETVSLRSILQSDKFTHTKMELPVGLGKTISNDDFVADLAKMPHLLMAGATGQGKSVCLNSILVSLLYKKHPSELKFVMVDPKKVELSLYNIIERHFLAKLPNEEEAIVTDTKKVINTLNALCIEMDARYDLLKAGGVRNIKEYNQKFKKRRLNPEKGHRYLPYIVLVIDEFADLIMTAGKEVEMPIARLAQLARAIGIHLVIATQRPTVNIITGTIKANFPVRIAFRVMAKVDSRTILDAGGANQLIGSGDMLLSIGGDVVRLQGAFVDTPEVERIAEFISEQQAYPEPFLLPEYRDDDDSDGFDSLSMSTDTLDDMFEEAARIIVQHQSGSTSLLQRRLKLGYNRAGRLMDQMEKMGIVGGNMGSKPREVFILDEFELDQRLRQIKQKRGLL